MAKYFNGYYVAIFVSQFWIFLAEIPSANAQVEEVASKLLTKYIHYLLWTRKNSKVGKILKHKNLKSIDGSTFDKSKKTYVLFHHYLSNGVDLWLIKGKEILLKIEDCNVINVNYNFLTFSVYPAAAKNSYIVAKQTASYIDWMVDNVGLDLSRVEFIGFSLGAQIAGIVGHFVTTGKISRITGLDPAGPIFDILPSDKSLDKTSAEFVDVIHTNGGTLISGSYGIKKSVGHIDFFPNGGEHQPGCPPFAPDLVVICSHFKAVMYWLESFLVDSPAFVSYPCKDWKSFKKELCTSCGDKGCPHMGFHVDRNVSGNFYLRVNKLPPFAQKTKSNDT